MQISTTVLCLSIALFAASGCSSVKMPYPLSEKATPIDQETFEGSWLLDGDSVVQVQFATNGVAQIAGLAWKHNQYRIDRGEAIVTKGTKSNYLSVRFLDEDGKWDGYYFCAYRFTDQKDLILWPPVPAAFEKKINEGVFQGVAEKGKYSTQVSITNAPAEILRGIDGADNLELFDYREPVVLKKISDKN